MQHTGSPVWFGEYSDGLFLPLDRMVSPATMLIFQFRPEIGRCEGEQFACSGSTTEWALVVGAG